MAKNFYSQEEACEKLGMDAQRLKDAVRDGKLREFRDGGKVTYKANEVDRLAAAEEAVAGDELSLGSLSGSLADLDNLSTAELSLEDSSAKSGTQGDELELQLADEPPAGGEKQKKDADATDAISLAADDALGGGPGGSTGGTGELVLEPETEDDSGIKLGSDADAISLEDTSAGEEDDKDGTVVSSIGVSVFDDDEVEVDADPLAQTVVSDGTEALGIDAVGSGSGLLDLTRESDDTSLGAELLDEIYPGDESAGGEMSEDTKAGLAEAIPEPAGESDSFTPAEAAAAEAPTRPAGAAVVTETRMVYAPDALSTGLTGMMFVGVLVMCLAGLTVASATQDVWPAIMETLFNNMLIVGGAALGGALIALGLGYYVGKRG